mgnify:CR=1 FL=1
MNPFFTPTPSGFERLYKGPLNKNDRFQTYQGLVDYVKNNDTAYDGQVVWVVEDSALYKIDDPQNEVIVPISFGEDLMLGRSIDLNKSPSLDFSKMRVPIDFGAG